MNFKKFWEICQEKLKIGDVIPNWSVYGAIQIKEFKITEITQDSISYDSPNAKNIQTV